MAISSADVMFPPGKGCFSVTEIRAYNIKKHGNRAR